MQTLRKHLTYANVMATIAVFLALGGGVAFALSRNSVESGHIKNGQVKSADLKDAVGAEVGFRASDDFSEGDPLRLKVKGYGTFKLNCDDQGTPADADDDTVDYAYIQKLGNNALSAEEYQSSTSDFATPDVELQGPEASDSESTFNGEDRLFARQFLLARNGSKRIIIEAYAFEDNTSTTDCVGWIRATKLR